MKSTVQAATRELTQLPVASICLILAPGINTTIALATSIHGVKPGSTPAWAHRSAFGSRSAQSPLRPGALGESQ